MHLRSGCEAEGARGEISMQSAPKSLPEMNAGERYAMMNTVSEALFDAAEHAADEGTCGWQRIFALWRR